MSHDFEQRICPECNVAMLYPHPNEKLDGMFKCELCGFCIILDKETNKNRTKNQK